MSQAQTNMDNTTGAPQAGPGVAVAAGSINDSPHTQEVWESFIKKAMSTSEFRSMKQGLGINTPRLMVATTLFKKLNKTIQEFNKESGLDIDSGLVPESYYENTYQEWKTALGNAGSEGNAVAAWGAFHDTYSKFHAFNQQYRLPQEWNINMEEVEELFGWKYIMNKAPEKVSWKLMVEKLGQYIVDASVSDFFKELNEDIQGRNKLKNSLETEGLIPEDGWENIYKDFVTAIEKAQNEENRDAALEADKVRRERIQSFNAEHHLPDTWICGYEFPEWWPRKEIENDPKPKAEPEDPELEEIPEHERQDTNDVTGLDELEEEVKNEYGQADGEVIAWWKRGVGSQVFVRYGKGPNTTYRIRAGASHIYNPAKVPMILSSGAQLGDEESTCSRGQKKILVPTELGTKKEEWAYTRKHVRGIVGIGWKVDDDDEDDIEPLELLSPEPYVIYPHTRALIEWTDGKVTLEDKCFLRRILKGSSLQIARVIYQKALRQEIRYRRAEGLAYKHLLQSDSGVQDKEKGGVLNEEEEEEEEVEEEAEVAPVSGKSNRVRFSEPVKGGAQVRPKPKSKGSLAKENQQLRQQLEFLMENISTSNLSTAPKGKYKQGHANGPVLEYTAVPQRRRRRVQRRVPTELFY